MNRNQEQPPTLSDPFLAGILGNARSDDEMLHAFLRAFRESTKFPIDGLVLGEPVSILAINYDGGVRRGLTAICRKHDRTEHTISLADVHCAGPDPIGPCWAAYRKWLGLDSATPAPVFAHTTGRSHKAEANDLDLSQPVDLVILNVKDRSARCRMLCTNRQLTLRSSDIWKHVPGEIVTVRGRKYWSYARHAYLSGDIESGRIDVAALDLTPLRLESDGTWEPTAEFWGEEDDSIPEWARPFLQQGSRPRFEMQQVLPGTDPESFDECPITRAVDLKDSGERAEADRLLMSLLESDLRCLDAHAHLGNFEFDLRVSHALRHYEMGVCIGELSLPKDFNGVLPWDLLDNRPFLRCLFGYSLSLWRLGNLDAALKAFDRLMWFNPADHQRARFLRDEIRQGRPWKDNGISLQ